MTLWTSTRRAAAASGSPTGRGHADAVVAVLSRLEQVGRAAGGVGEVRAASVTT
jgi:hypothetical protein